MAPGLLACGRLFLRFGLIVIDRGTDEIFQSRPIDLVALENVDRPPHLAAEAALVFQASAFPHFRIQISPHDTPR